MKQRQPFALSDVLARIEDWVELDPNADYKQVTMRLWGKGAVLRAIVKGSGIAARHQLRVGEGQFLMSKIDARNGAFGLVTKELDGAVVSQDFPSFLVNQDRLVPGFLEWMSKTGWFVELCRKASEGSTNRVRLQEERFLSQIVFLPLVPEQREIVARLDGIADRLAQVQKLKESIAADLESFITAAHFEAAQQRSVELRELFDLDEDQVEVVPGRDYPQVGIRGFGGGLFPKEAIQFGQTSYRHFNRLYENAFVVSQPKGWEGAVAICSSDFDGYFASPEYRTFRHKAGAVRPKYFSFLVGTPWFLRLLASATRGQGARRERLRPDMLLNLKIPMPDLDRQDRLLPALARVDQLRAVETSLDLYLIPSLLDQTFEGCRADLRGGPQLEAQK